MAELIYAPWDEEQLRSLAAWQISPWVHPFTCASRGDGNHIGESILTPTADGWTCPQCEYTQNWAHEFMVDGSFIPELGR